MVAPRPALHARGMTRSIRWVLLALAPAMLLAPRAGDAAPWERVGEQDGVTVWRREVSGSPLVEFRGEARVPVDFRQVLAVLHDPTRKTEWMEGCVEFRRLETRGPGQSVVYLRMGSTFPLVSDRDVVLASDVDLWRDRRQVKVTVTATEHASAPPRDGAVRMPRLDATWTLVARGPEATDVTYQVRADPGGAIPAWVVNLVSRKVPLRTLSRLRAQVQRPGYEADRARIDAMFDWTGFVEGGGPGAPPALATP
jgi:hypothetical protein